MHRPFYFVPESIDIIVERAALVEAALREFVSGSATRASFLKRFSDVLHHYKGVVGYGPYYPLDQIAANTDTDEAFMRLCREAIDRMPCDLFDRTAKLWIDANLATKANGTNDLFAFMNADGTSKFGTRTVLYTTRAQKQSFLLSGLNGSIKPAPFKYEALLQTLKQLSGGTLAGWALCTEVSRDVPIVNWVSSLQPAYEDLSWLNYLERKHDHLVQWSKAYMLLIPADYAWLLVNRYDFDELRVELHAPAAMRDAVMQTLKIEQIETTGNTESP